MKRQPAFIVSLPRSGSTLLQRMLSQHPSVTTSAESWLFLHLLGWKTDLEIQADFDYATARQATAAFMTNDRWNAFRAALEDFVDRISSGSQLVEKTPRHALLLDELQMTFPQAKFIVLLRNPVVVINSMLDAWGEGGRRWRLRPYYIDLYRGLPGIHRFITEAKAHAHILHYETLVQQPEAEMKRLCRFLEIDPLPVAPMGLKNVQMGEGLIGDQTGKRIDGISSTGVSSVHHLCNIHRRRWVQTYLDWLGSERLADLGYDLEDCRRMVAKAPGHSLLIQDGWEAGFQLLKVLLPLRRFSSARRRRQLPYMSEMK